MSLCEPPHVPQARERKSFSIFLTSTLSMLVAFGEALLQAGGDDGEAGPVQRAGDGGELGDDVLAVASLLEHPQHAVELARGRA